MLVSFKGLMNTLSYVRRVGDPAYNAQRSLHPVGRVSHLRRASRLGVHGAEQKQKAAKAAQPNSALDPTEAAL
jgi:hypothetical protein